MAEIRECPPQKLDLMLGRKAGRSTGDHLQALPSDFDRHIKHLLKSGDLSQALKVTFPL